VSAVIQRRGSRSLPPRLPTRAVRVRPEGHKVPVLVPHGGQRSFDANSVRLLLYLFKVIMREPLAVSSLRAS